MISVREAKTLPKTNCREWRNKFICVEGKQPQNLCTSCTERVHKNNSCLFLLILISPQELEDVFLNIYTNIFYLFM